MTRSASPSPLISPAPLTAPPERSAAVTPSRRKPFVPSRSERLKAGGKSAVPVGGPTAEPERRQERRATEGKPGLGLPLEPAPGAGSLRRFSHIAFSFVRGSSQSPRTRASLVPTAMGKWAEPPCGPASLA
jgi:hypothetical protein